MSIGAEFLAQGISSAGRNLGEGIARYREQRRKDKEEAAAFEAFGTALEHGVKQGMLPEGVLSQYMQAGQGTPAQKRGFLEGVANVIRYADQASVAEDRKAARGRADRYLDLQEGYARERGETAAAERSLRSDLQQYLTPSPRSVAGYPVPEVPQLTPEALAVLSARRGVAVPRDLAGMTQQQPSKRWTVEQMLQPFEVNGIQGVVNLMNGQVFLKNAPEPEKPRTVNVRKENPDAGEIVTFQRPWEEHLALEAQNQAPAPGSTRRYDSKGNLIR